MLFVIEHAQTGDILRSYDGMPQDTVLEILSASGNAFEFISQDEYNRRLVAAH